ncbi:hypothetical protein L596_013195 [Steinernema carpocapsae]|uniref:Uncharacterized protein n=1 Tax=Steinernema carpocapsae TaxID=34508 RepID=A0A4U5P0A1_STECR|nr:hypothetical protein L596_013195 [Steinernema carpocapsae]
MPPREDGDGGCCHHREHQGPSSPAATDLISEKLIKASTVLRILKFRGFQEEGDFSVEETTDNASNSLPIR